MASSVAIVGGSGGLGQPVCRALAAAGHPLLIGFHHGAERAESLAEGIRAGGGEAASACVDVRDSASIDAFLSAAEQLGSGLGGVVNAVGPPIPLKPLTEISYDTFTDIFATDVFGAFNLLTTASKRLRASGGGSVVQLLTTAVLRTLENDGMSGIPKTAIMGIVRQLAREVGQQNVRVNAVAPGVIDAGIVHSSFTVDETAQAVIQLCLDRTPMPRLGKPDEVGSLVAFLLSEGAAYINGQIIGIDGGYSA